MSSRARTISLRTCSPLCRHTVHGGRPSPAGNDTIVDACRRGITARPAPTAAAAAHARQNTLSLFTLAVFPRSGPLPPRGAPPRPLLVCLCLFRAALASALACFSRACCCCRVSAAIELRGSVVRERSGVAGEFS